MSEYQLMKREQIQPSPLNPRKHFDEQKLQELAGTMGNGVGIIEPLVVRPRPDLNRYELVAGERRWRAAGIAGLDLVPVVVKDLTDAQMLEIMVIENNQREDVNPLEEAEGFRQLMKLGGLDADALADRLGRSRKYVYDRVKLLDMIPLGHELLNAGRLTAGHGILLARLKPEDQERALRASNREVWTYERQLRAGGEDDEEDDVQCDDETGEEILPYEQQKICSVRELEHWIAHHVRFKVFDMATSAPLEFGETAEAVSRANAKIGRGKKVVPITFDYVAPHDTRDSSERTFGSSAWKAADGTRGDACEHSVLGVVVGGDGYGRSFQVCVARDKCEVHWKDDIREREKARKARTSEAGGKKTTARAAEDSWEVRQKREREVNAAEQKAWVAATPAMTAACVAAVKALKLPAVLRIIFSADWCEPKHHATALKQHLGGKSDAESLLRALALGAVLNEMDVDYRYGREDFQRFARKELSIDIMPMLKAVQTSAPKDDKAKPVKSSAAPKGKKKTKAVARKKAAA